MVRITKISAGTLLLILSIILMIKSGFENFIAALVGTGAIGGAAGILLAITYIIAAAIYILTNRTYSIVPDAVSFVILILGGLMGLFNSNLPDTKFLVIWSWVGIIIGAIVLIISIVDLIMNPAPAEDEEPDNGYNDEYANNGFDQPQNGYPQQLFGQQGQFQQQPMNQMQGQPQYGQQGQQQFNQPNPYQQPANNQFNNQQGYPQQPNNFQPAPQNNQYNQYGARQAQPNNQFNRQNNNQFNNQMNGMNQPQNPYGQNQMQNQRQLPSGQFNPRNNMNNHQSLSQQFPQQRQQTNYPAPNNNGQFGGNQFNNNNQNNQFGTPAPNNQMNNNQFGNQPQNPQQNQYPSNNNGSNGSYGFSNYDPSQSRSRR